MKRLFSIALVLFVTLSAMATNRKQSSRSELGINGDAIYVIEYTYNLHGGKDGGRQLVCIDSITFDKRGNFQDKFRTKNNEYTWYSYFFDVNGYALGWNEYNKQRQLTGRTAYLNDQYGNRIERTVYLGEHEKASDLNIKFQGIDDNLPTDHYLWLTGQGAKMLVGDIKMTEELPKR